jgi:hypothetical protein
LLRLVDRDHHRWHQSDTRQDVGLHLLVDGVALESACRCHLPCHEAEGVVAEKEGRTALLE